MSEPTNKQSILDMARGAIKERVDYEMSRIMDNILDVNTNPTKERSLTITVKFKPDPERQQISVQAIAKSKLEPTNPVATALFLLEIKMEKPQLLKWFHRFQDNNHLMEMKKTSQKYYG